VIQATRPQYQIRPKLNSHPRHILDRIFVAGSNAEMPFRRAWKDRASRGPSGGAPSNAAIDRKRQRIRVTLSTEIEKREGKVTLVAPRSYVMAKEATAGK